MLAGAHSQTASNTPVGKVRELKEMSAGIR